MRRIAPLLLVIILALVPASAGAQSFRFLLRAEPDVIPANGISTTTITVQVSEGRTGGFSAQPQVRFIASDGVIERQALLTNGIARVLLRSSSVPGTAIVTAIIGNSREEVAVEFTSSETGLARYLEVEAGYVAYGTEKGIITAAGPCVFEWGETRIESNVRLDIDLSTEQLWAEGNAGGVRIRHSRSNTSNELQGDRLYYDMRRRRGVMRRGNRALGPIRQEFMDWDSKPVPLAPPTPASLRSPQPVPSTPVAAPEPDKPVPGIVQPVVAEGDYLAEATVQPAVRLISDEGADNAPSRPRLSAALEQRENASGETATLPRAPDYTPLPEPEAPTNAGLVEPLPPGYSYERGYWITCRRLRVFPRDKVQFHKATIFINGRRGVSMPLYVMPLSGVVNPAQEWLGLNTSGGVTLDVPLYYMASPSGSGALHLQHAPRNGFSADRPGFALALDQQYWLSAGQQGRLVVDQLGKGAWNLNWQHQMQFTPTMNGAVYLDMPRHRDLYLRSSISQSFRNLQVGFEGLYSRPQDTRNELQAQFYARSRPRALGRSWTYNLAGTMSGARRNLSYITYLANGGGITVPGGGPRPVATRAERRETIWGQNLSTDFTRTPLRLWRGATFETNLFVSAFNFTDGRRGVAPGANLALRQSVGRRANFNLGYTFDRGSVTSFGSASTHFVNAGLDYTPLDNLYLSGYLTRGLNDDSIYSTGSIDYYLGNKWRMGLFADSASFGAAERYNTLGWSIGRRVGQREVTLNWDSARDKFYFELGGFR